MTSYWTVVRYLGNGRVQRLAKNGDGNFYWSESGMHIFTSKQAALEVAAERNGEVRQVFISNSKVK